MYKLLFILPIVLFAHAGTAHAQLGGTIEVTSSTGVEAESAMVDTKMDATVQTTAGTDVSTEAKGNLDVEVHTGASADGTMEEGDAMEAEAKSDSRVRVSGLGIAIDLTGEGSTETNVQSSAAVTTNADLDLYAQTVSARNKAITRIEAQEDVVTVSFKEKVRFLGFIPVIITNKVMVEMYATTEGVVQTEVKVRNSFLRFLSKAETKSKEIAAGVQSHLKANVNAQAQASAHVHAQALEAIDASVQAHVAANAAASVE